MERKYCVDSKEKVGEKILLSGWVDTRRDHGKIIFFDLRDSSGQVQVVVTPKQEEAYKIASNLSSEDVVSVEGMVNQRPQQNVNPEKETGTVEVSAEKITIISKSEGLPIPIEGDGYDIEETQRLQFRYIDLRRERLQKNLKLRSKISKLVRDFLLEKDFIEIETPYLSQATPEGARDFIVPSRLQKGNFYALPQSPQQYKQLLMIAGFERYFQLARAFRDEDLRADRQLEHTQIDMEMAFIKREEVMSIVEDMVKEVLKVLDKKPQDVNFPVLKYDEAMKKYDTDRPDLRKEKGNLAFAWVVDFPLFEKTQDGNLTFSHNPFASPKEEDREDLMKKENLENLKSLQYDLVCNGEEIAGGSIRINNPEVQKQIFKIMGYSDKEVEEKFGHLINAYKYGAPSHGGIAFGFDRFVALLAGEANIREVIAFPVTSGGQTSVMDAPNPVSDEQLKDLGISLVKKQDKKK